VEHLNNVHGAGQCDHAGHQRLISPGLIHLPSPELCFDEAFLVRDPDGHAMELVP